MIGIKGIRTTRVAVTGIAGGGKTVFLTSCLSHLAEYDEANLFFGGGVKLKSFYEPQYGKNTRGYFPLERYRRLMAAGGSWPDKTVDCFRYECEFERSDWHFFKQRLRFFDFPGERIADAAIAAMSDYQQWSNHILTYYKQHPDYAQTASEYFDMFKSGDIDEQSLIEKYELTLARLILGYKPLISPSCFLLGTDGSKAEPGTAEEIANLRYSGIDHLCRFAPMPPEICKAFPEITANMTYNYKLYRRQVVLPVFKELAKSDCLVILVDIPSLLAGGVGRYNDNRQILMDLSDAMRSDTSIGAKLLNTLKFWRPKLKKVAFVASKADLVYGQDVSNGNLESLLRQMTTRAGRLMPGVACNWFVCSACCSTRPGTGSGSLIGKLAYNNPQCKEMEFNVSRLPDAWPPQWDSGDYRFYKVFPQASPNLQIPPKSFGLDGILKFILGE